MTNFVYDNVALPADKASDVNPYSNPTQQWGKVDADAVFHGLRDTRLAVNGMSLNVKAFGAVGDGVTDDAAAFIAAITAASAAVTGGAFGAFVDVPKGTFVCGSQLSLPNGVGLRGAGPAMTILLAKSTLNAASLITNTLRDGTQEFAFLESVQIQGNRGGGAICSVAVVDFGSLFINSYIRDVVISEGSNVGLRLSSFAGSPGGMGPVYLENVWVANTTGHGIMIEEGVGSGNGTSSITGVNVCSEHQGTGKSAIYLKGVANATQYNFYNTHIEIGSAATSVVGITLDGVQDVAFYGIQIFGTPANTTAGVLITNVAQNTRFKFSHINNSNGLNPIISDLKNGVTLGAINVPEYVSPDCTIIGGQRFVPTAAGATTRSLVAQNASGTDSAWFDGDGRLSGNSASGTAIDIAANTADGVSTGRTLGLVNQARSRVFGFNFPDGSLIKFRCITTASDVWDADNSGNFGIANLLTVRAALKGVGARAAAPSSGTHGAGEIVFNADPIAGGFAGWICVTGGSPGTWKSYGVISP